MKSKITIFLGIYMIASLPLMAAKYYLYTGSTNPWGNKGDGTVTQVIGALNTTLNTYAGTDVVWIAAGTYTVDASIVLASGIQVYGGFAGNEATIADRQLQDETGGNSVLEPWEFKNATIINGVGFSETAVAYPIISSGANNYTLNGVTLDGHNTTNDKGGAIYSNARPTIEKCIIRNINQTAATNAYGGAGIYSDAVGGAYIYSCLIENCVTNKCGGAINAYKKVTVKGCVLRNNFASTASVSKGGAISLQNNADAPNTSYIINNAIYNNSSTYQGGALQLQGTNAEPCNIVNNTIVNNCAIGASTSTGGIIGLGTSTKLYNNIVYNNWEGATAGTIKNLRTSLTSATIDLQYSAYNGGTAVGTGSSFATTGNINNLSAPGFVNPSATTTKGYTATMPADVRAANFALQSNSGLNDMGAIFSSITPTDDILGSTRPTAAQKMDIGAYEFSNQNISDYSVITDIVVSRGGLLTVDATKTVASLTLAPGAKLSISSGILTATNGLTLQSDASGTATLLNSGTYTGTVTAQQYLGTARNWYVSSPVQTTNSPANNITRYYEYIEAGDNNYPKDGNSIAINPGETSYWKFWTTGNSMTVGKGYIAQVNAGTTVSFSGTANNGEVPVTVSRTESGSSRGFNLVGNPYPSYLDWSDVFSDSENAAAGISTSFWYRTKNTLGDYVFTTWNGTSNEVVGGTTANTAINRFIPPMQAFWVRVDANVGNTTHNTTLKFKNGMREHGVGDNNKLKAPQIDERVRLRLQLENGTITDETLIYFDTDAANNFDNYDSPKYMNNSAKTPDLYSKVGTERLVINGLNAIADNMELPLGFSLNAAATLKLKATEMSNFPIGNRIYLRDKQQNSETELTPETEYTFSTTETTTNNESRFSLLFKAPNSTTGTVNTERDEVSVFVNTQNEIVILAKENSNYTIYNAVGQQIAAGTIINHLPLTINQLKGVYVVKVNNQSIRVVVK